MKFEGVFRRLSWSLLGALSLMGTQSAWSEEGARLVLPEGKPATVKVSFKASPESTPGKGLLAELCLGDSSGQEIPVQCLRIDAHPAFKDSAKPVVHDKGRILEFSAQKGEWEFFVPADVQELVVLGVLFGYGDRKVVLDYQISVPQIADRMESGKSNEVKQRLVADHTNKTESRILRIAIERAK